MKVSEVMCPEFEIATPDTTLREAAQMMRDGDFGYLPVGENDRLSGALTDRDIVIRAVAEGLDADTPVRQIMTENVVYCFEDNDISEAGDVMRTRQIRRLVVLDRDKRMVGILSIGDIARDTDDSHLTGKIETGVAQET
ncbi:MULTISPECIES: CBS domain-containing protein [Asticcacaulis]|uniref:CBS domain-containing protein n=1 Tax=Asticcacaulis TaxID=76890 RepID=UPI001AE91F0B|nr:MULTISPECIES: CBS domain-containing protein [Asticcacaulis]MBP2159199.1 CBS domain-containing protein [Asticcacaulis solisilvae]MDR6800244.1 CBS domain-containing protein [Asticcacaulis sp. BE141]